MATFDIVVFGSLHMDIMVDAPDRPQRGETLAGTAWAFKPGGKGGNQAVEAARSGARTAFVGAVGADRFGADLVRHLEGHGVAPEVAARSEAPTGLSVAITDPGGDYGAVIVSGANLLLGPAEAEAAVALLASSGVLVLQNEIPEGANAAALAAARRLGRRTILNAAPARPLPPDFANNLDVLVVNAIEAEMLSGIVVRELVDAAKAAAALRDHAGAVVVTAGAAGVAAARPGAAPVVVPGHPVAVVSTHGAGDCFVGALASRLAHGDALEDALVQANRAAALHVGTPAGTSTPRDPDVLAKPIAPDRSLPSG